MREAKYDCFIRLFSTFYYTLQASVQTQMIYSKKFILKSFILEILNKTFRYLSNKLIWSSVTVRKLILFL